MTDKKHKKEAGHGRFPTDPGTDGAVEDSTVCANGLTGALPRPPLSDAEAEAAAELFPEVPPRPFFPGTVRPADDGPALFPGYFSQKGRLDAADCFVPLPEEM